MARPKNRDIERGRSSRRVWRTPVFAFSMLVVVFSLGACSSQPVRAYQGAREYAVGTDALDRGESAVAIEALERAAALVPEASEVQNHLGLAYWQSGNPSRARSAFERALELDCDNAAARTNLARLDAAGSDGVDPRARRE